ncbi:MAG TPA: hypothetical protein VG253_04880 [Streptosporangiaceae bacterium]|jgi:hypothetical protein|nr:hypothetical protein [Streptosporangiaceae bacterium]
MSPLTGVLGEAWTYYKRFAGHFLTIAFMIYIVTAILVGLLSLAGYAGFSLGSIVNFIGFCLVEAALVKAIQDVRDGRVDLTISETVAAAVPYLLPVAAAAILAGIGIAIGFVLLIIPGLVLLTFWSLIVPEIVIGGAGPIQAFSRSWRTVRGYAWKVFGIYILVFLILVAFNIVISVILVALPSLPRSLISSVVSGTLVTPFVALVVTLIYYRLTTAHGGSPDAQPGESAAPPPGAAP